jgi:hypothetical protein
MRELNFRKFRCWTALTASTLMLAGTTGLLAAHVIDPLEALFATGVCAIAAVLLALLPWDGPEARALSIWQQPAQREQQARRRDSRPMLPRRLGDLRNAA